MTDQNRPHNATPDDEWEALARFVAEEASSDERAEMQRRLAADPALASLVRALDEALMVREPLEPTSREVELALASVLSRRDDVPKGAEPRRAPVVSLDSYRSRWRDARLRAAAAVLVVAGAGLIWRASVVPKTVMSPNATQTRFATAVGALDSMRLPDGSRVLLGPGSELTLGDDFGGSARELSLKGEARFDVVHDSAHPFVVHTPAASFRDVGTIFAVHSDAGDGARLVVTAGAVAVESKSGGPAITLKAGDRATVATQGAVRVERSAVTNEDLAWTSGHLVFRDAPVAQVTADLRRWYGIELSVDSALATRKLTATFERGSATDVGRVVAAVLGGGLHEEGGTMRIVAPPASTSPK